MSVVRAQWLCCAQLHNLPAEHENAVLDVIQVVEDDEARLLVVGGLGGVIASLRGPCSLAVRLRSSTTTPETAKMVEVLPN